MERTKTVEVARFGSDGEPIPHKLLTFMARLGIAAGQVPTEYLEAAEIDFGPQWEHGEAYEQVRVTYERPETPEEREARDAAERRECGVFLEVARRNVAYYEARLAELEGEA